MPDTNQTMDEMAEEIWELFKVIAAARSRSARGPDPLSETEFLTLDLLVKEQPLTIGDVQKRIGVVPAQMSRVVRSLEESGKGYVGCQINPADRRRIDLSITDEGRKAHETFRAVRLASMHGVLEALDAKDRCDFMRMLRSIHTAFARK